MRRELADGTGGVASEFKRVKLTSGEIPELSNESVSANGLLWQWCERPIGDTRLNS